MAKNSKSKAIETEAAMIPLIDSTAALPSRSKRTERRQKKRELRTSKLDATLSDLPPELLTEILILLRPSDIFALWRVNRSWQKFISTEELSLCQKIVARRYSILSRCFTLPVQLQDVDQDVHPALLSDDRLSVLNLHCRSYKHIKPADPHLICTCLTCILAWNNLNLAVDFAHWQPSLDRGEPIPMIAFGKHPQWNQQLTRANARVVQKALQSPLWYSRILERHLKSTVGSIHRHKDCKGGGRKSFPMSAEDAASGTDLFLERSGPRSLDFPLDRDYYYTLDAYVPNRAWKSDAKEWRYWPASQHEADLDFVMASATRRKAASSADKMIEKAIK